MKRSPPALTIELGSLLTSETAKAEQLRLLAAVKKHQALRCDVSQVSTCDTVGIQLLCAAASTALQVNCGFVLVNPGSAVLDAARRVGVPLSAIGILAPQLEQGAA